MSNSLTGKHLFVIRFNARLLLLAAGEFFRCKENCNLNVIAMRWEGGKASGKERE